MKESAAHERAESPATERREERMADGDKISTRGYTAGVGKRGYTAKIGGGRHEGSVNSPADRGDGAEGPSRRGYRKGTRNTGRRGR